MTTIIAHRGYSAFYPENTLLAFQAASRFPIEGIELDVHLTKDGEVVIIHDESIDRTSNGKGWVKDQTLTELRQYDYFGRFPETIETHPSLIQLLTLREFLEWMIPLDLMVNIELKTNIFRYEGLNQKVLELIQEMDLADRVIISSFNHHSLLDFMKRAKGLPIEYGFLTGEGLLDPGKYCQTYGVNHYHPHFVTLEPEDVNDCRNRHIQINTYTVNEEAHLLAMKELGVDRVITNYVERALDLFQ